MNESFLTSKGQVTIPQNIRNRMGLEAGDRLAFVADGSYIHIVPIKGDIFKLEGILQKAHAKRGMDYKKIRQELPRIWAEQRAKKWGLKKKS